MEFMDVIAITYDLGKYKGKKKVYKRREVFGYKDFSNNKQYLYKRPGKITGYILKAWNKPVILVKVKDEKKVNDILNRNGIKHKNIKISIEL